MLVVLQMSAATNSTKVAVVTTWGGDCWGVRKDFLPWLQLMTELGTAQFYVSAMGLQRLSLPIYSD